MRRGGGGLGIVVGGIVALGGSIAWAGDEGARRIHPDVPWALTAPGEAEVDAFEQRYGVRREEVPVVEPFWQDGMLFTRDSHARSILEAQGLDPLPAVAYEPAPGVLYVAMDGVTLEPSCIDGQAANAARNCSPLVESTTTFPPFGSGAARQQLVQQLAAYYEPFNVVLTVERPPEWVPYTMAVIGGAAGLAGQPNGVCGVANVACDGLQRNHVSLTFPNSCGGVAEIAAQETSHNWGLEHTDNRRDLLYPVLFGNDPVKSFVDECMPVNHDTGSGVTQCGYIHEAYCPDGGGEQQNSFAELLGVFGPRVVDDVAPVITSISPADGTVLGPDDSATLTATVSEDSNFLAVRWTWLEGLPAEMDEFTKCTNNVCTDDFNPGVGFDVDGVDWTFLTLERAPAGRYRFQFEAADAYGHYVTRMVTIDVQGGAAEGEAEAGDDESTRGGTSPEDGTTTAAPEDTTEDEDGDEESESGQPRAGGPEANGCACTSPSRAPRTEIVSIVCVLPLAFRRRRHARGS